MPSIGDSPFQVVDLNRPFQDALADGARRIVENGYVALTYLSAKTFGINAGILFEYLVGWGAARDWRFRTAAEIEEDTCLTPQEQRTARAKLKDTGVLHEKLQGAPPVVNYRIDWDRALVLINESPGRANKSIIKNQRIESRVSTNQKAGINESLEEGVRRSSNKSSPIGERAEARRISKDERTKKRLALWRGYLNGLGIDEKSPGAAAMQPAAFRGMTAPIVDSDLNSATLTTLARWSAGYAKTWKASPPTILECINLLSYWDSLGRPRDFKPEHDPKSRKPAELPTAPMTPAEAERKFLAYLRTPDAWNGTDRSKYSGKFGAENLARDIAASEAALKGME